MGIRPGYLRKHTWAGYVLTKFQLLLILKFKIFDNIIRISSSFPFCTAEFQTKPASRF